MSWVLCGRNNLCYKSSISTFLPLFFFFILKAHYSTKGIASQIMYTKMMSHACCLTIFRFLDVCQSLWNFYHFEAQCTLFLQVIPLRKMSLWNTGNGWNMSWWFLTYQSAGNKFGREITQVNAMYTCQTGVNGCAK